MEIKLKIIGLLSTVFLIFSIIHEGDSSISCYSCSSQRNSSSSCERNVSYIPTSTVNCSLSITNNFTHCVTIITNTSLVRDCANASSCNPSHGYQQCFLCTSDYCNKDSIASSPWSPSIGAGSQPGYGGSGSQYKPGVTSKPGSGRANGAAWLILVVCIALNVFLENM
ncbi:unnamed protein product [Phyllotreta striolata]|uniref:Uncharacterized protein n=1 Tax=Phyllotreta striolata TaxID=444603 RepID=A0A9N9XUC3_PHYSR|nr:unnamed protein product [Phyllotreta striolata]